MRLYHIQFDGESYWVEAETMARAVSAWQKHQAEDYADDGDWDGTEEPDSCHLVHDQGVIRASDHLPEKCEGCPLDAVTHDGDGVPLCRGCADSLKEDPPAAEKSAP